MTGAVTRYRILAYLVGALLLALAAGVVLKYGYHRPALVAIVGPVHGFFYIVYLIAGYDLARRARWPLRHMLQIFVAGLVPLLTFVIERVVMRRLRGQHLIGPPAPAPSAGDTSPAHR